MKTSAFLKSTLSTLATVAIVGGVAYAAITYPATPPTWETTGGKFRTELDKIWSTVSIDQINKRVGIWTAVPQASLDVYSLATNGAGLNLQSGLAGGKSYGLYSTNTAATGGAGNFLIYSPNNTNGQTVPFLVQPNGNIGIWNVTPAYKLDVSGDILNNGWYRSQGVTGWYNNTYGGWFYMADTSWVRSYNEKGLWMGNGLLWSNGGLTVWYGWAGSPGGWAIIAGNVGIGTTAPWAKLDVNGNAIVGWSIGIGWAPENGSWGMSIHKDDWAIVTRKANWADNAEPQNARGSIYTNDVFLRSAGKWVSQMGTSGGSVTVYSCPVKGTCDNGTAVTGDWMTTGCVWQIATSSYCNVSWWNGGGHTCANGCSYVGKMVVN